MNKFKLLVYALAFSSISLFYSCGSVKYPELLMMDNVQNEVDTIGALPALTIRTDDILSIVVTSRNPETIRAFLLQTGRSTTDNPLAIPEGYRVDEEGNIYLPFLGPVQAVGKTIVDLRQELMGKLVDFIPDASIQIRFMNFRITILGEVRRPSTFSIPNERITILEAIGMAGDFTEYARRNSVLVIRERNDIREYARVNTQEKDLFRSPYFYLSPNDIIYVKPLKAKRYITQGDFIQRYSIILVPVISSIFTVLVANAFN